MRVKTSETDPIGVGWLGGPGGRVGLTFAPGKHANSFDGSCWERSLDADLARLRDVHGASVLVCLLEDHELERFNLSGYVEATARHGFRLHRLPIRDGGLPPDEAAVRATLAAMAEDVAAGRRVVVHCRGGLGRAGTIGGCWLVEQGASGEEALAQVRAARGPKSPESEPQRAYVRHWRPTAPPTSDELDELDRRVAEYRDDPTTGVALEDLDEFLGTE